MPRPTTLLLGVLPVTFLGVGYYQHRRLFATYPSLPVPPAYEIAARKDRPAFGRNGFNSQDTTEKEQWILPHAGHMLAATVPQQLLQGKQETAEDTPVIVFARAFWDTWPLRIERRIVHVLDRIGLLFQLRGGLVGAVEEHNFVETARILGGLFVVEAHDRPSGPLIASWWLRSSQPKPISVQPPSDRGAARILGGYHSFIVQDIQSPADGKPSFRLCFVCDLVTATSQESTRDVKSLPLADFGGAWQKIFVGFHEFYARLLLDLAIRRLQRA
ncbi:hypothetical protein R3P38DRAFT_3475407 [Favolaschia claudopus]|uniref:Uncharacterized protein n=1 Tax=Favolaschia claudopus TaxID=2862362 RepID=A0AAW0CL85_9AGAR